MRFDLKIIHFKPHWFLKGLTPRLTFFCIRI